MTPSRDEDSLRRLLTDGIVGRRVTRFEVHGINTLKTVEPSLSDLIGASVTGFECYGQDCFEFSCGDARVIVHLAGTGTVRRVEPQSAWTRATGRARPTAQVWFDDGSGLDFVEPAHTKRIAIALTRDQVAP